MSEELRTNMNKYAHIHTRVLFLRYKKDVKLKFRVAVYSSLFKQARCLARSHSLFDLDPA